jgi:hypothetical protein
MVGLVSASPYISLYMSLNFPLLLRFVLLQSVPVRPWTAACRAKAKHDAWNLHEDSIFDIFMRVRLRWVIPHLWFLGKL